MPDLPVLLVVVVAVVIAVVVRRGRTRKPVSQPFNVVAQARDLRRMSAADAAATLEPFGTYLGEEGTVDIAVGGPAGNGILLLAAVGIREPVTRGRPWYVAVIERTDLAVPPIAMDPRSVRTVRVVATDDEVVIEDPRISRGWRITSTEPGAAAVLNLPDVRDQLSDALHRPMPFIVGLRTRPGAVAVHLSGAGDAPSDGDDLERLARLAQAVGDALAGAPARP